MPRPKKNKKTEIQEYTSMSWPRGSFLAALLVLSIPLASADTITVNTTTDDDADNSLCSLREAVEYFNRDKPADGYQGCESSVTSTSDNITIPSDSNPYLIASRMDGSTDRGAIVIRRSVSISGGGIASNNRTLLQVVGAHRAFVISDTPLVLAPDCSITTTHFCNPAGAPALDSASDTDVLGDFLTTDTKPKITISPVTMTGTDTYTVILYDKPYSSEDDPVAVGSLVASSATTDWSITTTTLKEGLHDLTYTLKLNNEDEGSHSVALRLGVHPAAVSARTVTLSQMEIQGCVTATIIDCANNIDGTLSSTSANGLTSTYTLASASLGKGGIIYVEESLDTNNTIVHDGAAVATPAQGGAIWAGDAAVVSTVLAQFRDNSAAEGAAIFASKNALGISQSLFTENTPSMASGAVVKVADSASSTGSSGASQISDSTFSGNDGLALSLRAGAIVSGSTIVLNQGGIDFSFEKVSVYNTILAGNPDSFPAAPSATDCLRLPAATNSIDFKFSLAVTGGGCDAVASGLRFLKNDNQGTPVPAEKLMAQDAAGKCVGYDDPAHPELAAFTDMGLLCPLTANNKEASDVASATHLPRLLNDYSSAGDSPIIGKGSTNTSTTDACSGTDQRGKTRRTVCDIGAAELQAITGTLVSGNAITYDHTYTEALDSNLDDEQLFLPSVSSPCPSFALTQVADQDVPGCPWITVPPSRGAVVFNTDGSYTYTPNGNYHGFDRFSFRVVTTLSKLNSTNDSQSRLINAQVIVEPSGGISSYAAAGALDVWALLALSGLALTSLHRARRKQ
jgi:CSLREA domain-containing protein